MVYLLHMIYYDFYEMDHDRQLSPDYAIIYNLPTSSTSVNVTLNLLFFSPNIFCTDSPLFVHIFCPSPFLFVFGYPRFQ